jgi:hypothetical protein
MSKPVHSIWSHDDRKYLASVIMDPSRVPAGTRVHFTGGRRTNGQNLRMWGTLTSISEQVTWHGLKLEPEDWKLIFSSALKTARIVPNLDGNGFVVLGVSTSSMSRDEIDNLQEMIYHFGATHGVTFNEPRDPPGLAPTGPREGPSEREIERSQSRIKALFAATGEDIDEGPGF